MTDESEPEGGAEPSLSPPDPETIEGITREVSWENRLEGRLYVSGPGDTVQDLYTLESVANFLKAGENFALDTGKLVVWIRDTLGDPELAEAISDRSAGERDRAGIRELIEERLSQCTDESTND